MYVSIKQNMQQELPTYTAGEAVVSDEGVVILCTGEGTQQGRFSGLRIEDGIFEYYPTYSKAAFHKVFHGTITLKQ